MFAVKVYAAVGRFVHLEDNSQRDAARVFGLSRETISKMCRFSIPPGYTRTEPVRCGSCPGARQRFEFTPPPRTPPLLQH